MAEMSEKSTEMGGEVSVAAITLTCVMAALDAAI